MRSWNRVWTSFLCVFAFTAPATAQPLPKDAGIPVIDWKEAKDYRGQSVIVQGRIVQTRNIGRICFLNFDTARSFTAIVHRPNYQNFPEPPERMYDQKIVRIRGTISEYRGKAQIEIVKPDQVTILDEALLIERPASQPSAARDFDGRLTLATFNVLNLFDEYDDPYRADEGTPAKPKEQLQRLAETIQRLDADVLALQEVENRDVLVRFVKSMLGDMGYEHIVSLESNAQRGIECSVLSRFAVGPVTTHRFERFPDEAGRMMGYNRDLLQVRILPPGAEPFDVFTVHLKSKRGGAKETEATRVAECKQARQTLDGVLKSNPQALFVICGDFNDTWNSAPLKILRGRGETALLCFQDELPTGTNSYNARPGDNLIDFIYCSPEMAKRYVAKTYRVVQGTVATSGSDHNPVAAEFRLKTTLVEGSKNRGEKDRS